ncbi:hypothetical protein, partial [Floccifex sp.]|uniref:hypothetical protein n=1 Tax=Floccifex sp. TaxID=2815810 RepID=UPI003F060BA7
MRINPIYHEKGALHISEIDATSNHLIPICDCDIFVFQDGTIEIYDNENNLFEHCFIWDILQENHFNLDMSLKFKNKNFRITFPNKESKIHFCDILEKNTYILIKKA